MRQSTTILHESIEVDDSKPPFKYYSQFVTAAILMGISNESSISK